MYRRRNSLVIYMERTLVMSEAEGFEKIHVHYCGACRDYRVHHVVFHQVGVQLHTAAALVLPAMVRITAHDLSASILLYISAALARSRAVERHAFHGIYYFPGVELCDIDMLNRVPEVIFFFI